MAANEPIKLELTPEQTLELEKIRAENAASRAQVAGLEERNRAAEAEQIALQRGEAERDALLECKVLFYNAPEALQFMKADPAFDVRYDPAAKRATAISGKERVGLSEALRQFALAHPALVDGRSLRGLTTVEAPKKARSEMNLQEKVKFIEEHGDLEYGRLAAHPVQAKEIRTFADYLSLPVQLKTKLVAENGVRWLQTLSRGNRKTF